MNNDEWPHLSIVIADTGPAEPGPDFTFRLDDKPRDATAELLREIRKAVRRG